MTKRCADCGEVKNFSLFHKNAQQKDGYSCYCKKCSTDRNKNKYIKASQDHEWKLKQTLRASKQRAEKNNLEHTLTLNDLKQLYPQDNKCPILNIDLLKNSARDRLEGTEDIYTSIRGLARELGLPIVTPSQANRTGAKSDIIEGDNIAGSYSKLMIGDIVVSLARNRKDKLEGTGRWHIMKNRLGADGMTFASKIDTATGHIEIYEDFLEIEDTTNGGAKKSTDYNALDKDEKDFLKNFILSSD